MSQPLAKVLDDAQLAGARGPDGAHEIVVPGDWLEQRLWVEVPLPRLLRCAACDGGGCGRCDRSGAVESRPRGAPAVDLTVQMPPAPAVLRLPRQGGLAPDQERGHLLLTVRSGDAPTPGLRCQRPAVLTTAATARPPTAPPYALIVVTLAAVAALLWRLLE